MGMASNCCCEPTRGAFAGSNWIWILLILFCCGGFGSGSGPGSVLGDNLFRGDPPWILMLAVLYCCCSRRGCC